MSILSVKQLSCFDSARQLFAHSYIYCFITLQPTKYADKSHLDYVTVNYYSKIKANPFLFLSGAALTMTAAMVRQNEQVVTLR